jgi:hypothetical protein
LDQKKISRKKLLIQISSSNFNNFFSTGMALMTEDVLLYVDSYK